MILKVKIQTAMECLDEKIPAWEYIDNIDKVVVEEIAPFEKGIYIEYFKKGSSVIKVISNEGYLLNNEGKTIERIF